VWQSREDRRSPRRVERRLRARERQKTLVWILQVLCKK